MRKQLLLAVVLMVSGALAFSEVSGQRSNSFKNIDDVDMDYLFGLHAGSQGFGINAAYAFNEVFSVRLAGSMAPVGLSRTRSWVNRQYNLDMDARFYNTSLVAEVKPFRASSSSPLMQKLALVGGGAYFFKSEASALAAPTGNYYYGEVLIPRGALGSIKAHIQWKGWAPYFGAGIRGLYLGSLSKRGYLGLNIDIGSYYLSHPEVKLSADKLLSGNVSNEKIIQRNLQGYRWLPVVQLGISYGFVNY